MNILNVELETARKIFWLAKHDYIFLHSYNEEKEDWDDGCYPAINCNDVFVPGSDSEILNECDLDAYVAVCKKYHQYAFLPWCVVKRVANPWRKVLQYEDHVAIRDVRCILAKHSLVRAWKI